MPVLALANDDPLQSLSLFLGRNLARHTGVIHRGHVDQEAPWQSDVAGYTRTLLADGFLRNLNQDLLPFLQQVTDEGYRSRFAAAETACSSTTSTAATIAAIMSGTIVTRTSLRALGVTGRRRRAANFCPRVNCAIPASLGVEHRFRLRLSFFEFGFLGVLFRGRSLASRYLAGLYCRLQMNLRHGLPGIAIQLGSVRRPCYFLKFVIAFIGGRFVVSGINFLFFDSFFFHGPRCGKCGSLVLIQVVGDSNAQFIHF